MESNKHTISKKNQEIREKVLVGLKENYQKLLTDTKKNNGYLVISHNGKVIKLEGDAIPDTVKEFEEKYTTNPKKD